MTNTLIEAIKSYIPPAKYVKPQARAIFVVFLIIGIATIIL